MFPNSAILSVVVSVDLEFEFLRIVCYLILGDGGNDVSMIQAADAGVGIEGKVRNIFYLRGLHRLNCTK